MHLYALIFFLSACGVIHLNLTCTKIPQEMYFSSVGRDVKN